METPGQRRGLGQGCYRVQAGNASFSAGKMTVFWDLANVPLERKAEGPNEKTRPACQGKGWDGVCSLGLVQGPPCGRRLVRGSGLKSPMGIGPYSRGMAQKLRRRMFNATAV